jgi:hypothetical protein
MSSYNHNRIHRPLRGGIAVVNPQVNETGTIGLIGTSNGHDRWIVSCYHVLCRVDLSAAPDNEPIFQPDDDPANLIARTSIERSDTILDCAAARVLPEVPCVGEILHLSRIFGVAEPVAGMRVIKSGSVTGVSEGVITDLDGDEVEIRLDPSLPGDAELTKPGDSGSIWVSRAGLNAVALHKSGAGFGFSTAMASRLSAVLDRLKLRPVFD